MNFSLLPSAEFCEIEQRLALDVSLLRQQARVMLILHGFCVFTFTLACVLQEILLDEILGRDVLRAGCDIFQVFCID